MAKNKAEFTWRNEGEVKYWKQRTRIKKAEIRNGIYYAAETEQEEEEKEWLNFGLVWFGSGLPLNSWVSQCSVVVFVYFV